MIICSVTELLLPLEVRCIQHLCPCSFPRCRCPCNYDANLESVLTFHTNMHFVSRPVWTNQFHLDIRPAHS